jgi:hypothetical protein
LLGHTKIETTVRYLGIEVDDVIEIAEMIDIYSALAKRGGSAWPRYDTFLGL